MFRSVLAVVAISLAASLAQADEAKHPSKVGLVVPLQPKQGQEKGVESFLKGGLALVQKEPGTNTWYAWKGDKTDGIFDTFADDAGRDAHLHGKVAAALMQKAPTLLATPPDIQKSEVLASRVLSGKLKVGLYVPLEAKAGQEQALATFLASAKDLLTGEPGTLSWFAVRTDATHFAIFDAFADEKGRDAHLNGKIAAALFAKADELLAAKPEVQKVQILASLTR